MGDINNKSTSNQMRIFMKRMRNGYDLNENNSKNLSMRDMLKITRMLNEDNDETKINKKTVYDQKNEEEKFLNFFRDMNVSIKFSDLVIYNNLIFWGGTIDGIIQFIYKVTPDDATSGVEFNYLEDFTPDNPENDKIISKVESYYDTFYKYWRNNMLH